MNIHRTLCAIFVLTMLPVSVFAGDCDSVLRLALYDKTVKISSSDRTKVLTADMCSKSYEDAKNLFLQSQLTDYGGFLSGDFSGGAKFSQKHNQVCSSKTQAEWERSYAYYSETLVHGNPTEAWLSCMKAKELSCWFQTYETTYTKTSKATLYINWSDSAPAEVVRDTSMSGVWTEATQSPLLYKKGDKIARGEHVFDVTSYDVNKDATLSLNVELKGDNKSCVAVFRGYAGY